jgi:hypothetical protein
MLVRIIKNTLALLAGASFVSLALPVAFFAIGFSVNGFTLSTCMDPPPRPLVMKQPPPSPIEHLESPPLPAVAPPAPKVEKSPLAPPPVPMTVRKDS